MHPKCRTGSPLLGLWRRLGPGLVTGAADDDPSGIATHSQIGAQFGFALAWTFVFSFPLMVVIQQVAAEIGSVTGRGIAHNLRRHYSPWLLTGVVTLLLVANIINLGGDLGAMGAALELLIGGPGQLYTLLFGVVCIVLEVWLSYPRYAAILKWSTLSLFSYVAVVFVADVPWGTALKSLFVPSVEPTGAYAMAMVAILGTTISPYLFFWQAGQEVEEQHPPPSYQATLRVAEDGWRGTGPDPRRYDYWHGIQLASFAGDRFRNRGDTARARNH
jgi:NRAMP (natural resistance-associated macrophage protein)-like metal ion transporter